MKRASSPVASEPPRGRRQPPSPRWRGFTADLLALVIFAVLASIMTWPLVLDLPRRLVSWGDPVFQAWTLAWDIHALLTDPRHIFDANIFYPYRNTLAYSDTLFGQAALVAPLLVSTGNAILADNVAVLLALTLSGFAMYLLVVDLTGNRLAGIVAGIAYVFAPARMAHLEHLHILSAQWLPLGVLAARRALLGNSFRWAVVLGVIVLLQGLFGLYYLYFLAVLLAVVAAIYALSHPTRAMTSAISKTGLACLIAGLLLLPTLLPYQRVHNDLGIERSVEEVTLWRAQADDYLAVSPNNRLYGPILGARYHRDLEQDLFPGLMLAGFALLGFIGGWRRWETWMLIALTATAIILSFGFTGNLGPWKIPLPYHLLYDYVPGFRAIRVPARFGLLALVGLAGLAGFGLDTLLRRVSTRIPNSGTRFMALTAIIVLLSTGVLAETSTRLAIPEQLPASLAEAQRPDYEWLTLHPAPTIEFPMGEGTIASAWPNFWSTFHWNPVVNGYSGLTPPVYYVFRNRMRDFPSPTTIRLLQGIGIRTVVYHLPDETDPESDPVLSKIGAFPQLTQVVGRPDYVYQLQPDPWLWDLTGALPAGSAIDLPEIDADPATFGMLAAILQRNGHPVYGNGAIDYWRLKPAPDSVCYAILPATLDSAQAGYPGAAAVQSREGLTVYRAKSCAG